MLISFTNTNFFYLFFPETALKVFQTKKTYPPSHGDHAKTIHHPSMFTCFQSIFSLFFFWINHVFTLYIMSIYKSQNLSFFNFPLAKLFTSILYVNSNLLFVFRRMVFQISHNFPICCLKKKNWRSTPDSS